MPTHNTECWSHKVRYIYRYLEHGNKREHNPAYLKPLWAAPRLDRAPASLPSPLFWLTRSARPIPPPSLSVCGKLFIRLAGVFWFAGGREEKTPTNPPPFFPTPPWFTSPSSYVIHMHVCVVSYFPEPPQLGGREVRSHPSPLLAADYWQGYLHV
jgi:hypothetical protein